MEDQSTNPRPGESGGIVITDDILGRRIVGSESARIGVGASVPCPLSLL